MPKNWKTYKLGEFAKLRKEGIKPSDFNGEKYIGLEHIGQGNFLLDGIGDASDVTSNKSKFAKGDILYGKIRPYFKKVYRPKFSGICSTDMLVINSSNEKIITQNYLHQIIKSQEFTDKATETSTGTKMPRADWNSLKLWEINLPPLPEQKAIANILSAIDDKIENNLAINKTLEDMAMAFYKHWFIDFEFPVTQETHSELVEGSHDTSSNTHKIKKPLGYKSAGGEFIDSELGPIPKGWEVKQINDFGKIVCGKTPLKKVSEYYDSDDYPFIKIPDMHGNVWILNTNEKLSEKGNQSQIKKLLPEGSINVSCIATVGLVTININPSHTNQQINSIIPNSIEYRYFLYLSMVNLKETFLNEASGGSATLNMNTSTFSNVDLMKPKSEVVNQFYKVTSNLFDRIKNNQIENQTLTTLRDTLLPKLISGEVRLKAFKEQVESVIASEEQTTQSHDV